MDHDDTHKPKRTTSGITEENTSVVQNGKIKEEAVRFVNPGGSLYDDLQLTS